MNKTNQKCAPVPGPSMSDQVGTFLVSSNCEGMREVAPLQTWHDHAVYFPPHRLLNVQVSEEAGCK